MDKKDSDLEKLEKLVTKQIKHAIRVCKSSEKFSRTLTGILDDAKDCARKIIDHLETGDRTDQKLNSKLWHELYNIQHQLQNFSKYTQGSAGEVKCDLNKSLKLIEKLCAIRPPKGTK